MSEEEREAIECLRTCSMLPGSWDKRFVRSLVGRVEEDKPLTDKQKDWLWKLVWKYRKQHKSARLIALAAVAQGQDARAWLPQEGVPC